MATVAYRALAFTVEYLRIISAPFIVFYLQLQLNDENENIGGSKICMIFKEGNLDIGTFPENFQSEISFARKE